MTQSIAALIIGCYLSTFLWVVIIYYKGWWCSEQGRRQRNWIAYKSIHGITLDALHKMWSKAPEGLSKTSGKCILAATIPDRPSFFMLKIILKIMVNQGRLYHQGDLIYKTNAQLVHHTRQFQAREEKQRVVQTLIDFSSCEYAGSTTIHSYIMHLYNKTRKVELYSVHASTIQDMFDDFLLVAILTQDLHATDDFSLFNTSLLERHIKEITFMSVYYAHDVRIKF